MISLIDELNHKQFTDQISQGAKASFAIAVVYAIAIGIILGLNNSPILQSHTQFLISPLPILILVTAISSYVVYIRKKELGVLVKNAYEKIKEKIGLEIDFEDFVILNKVLINRIKESKTSPGLNFMDNRKVYGSENGRFLIIGEKEIGSGGFKQVFVAVDLLSRHFFAAKKTNHPFGTIKQKIYSERAIEKRLASYPSFKKPAFVFLDNKEYILEIEELYDGDLNKLINAKHTFTPKEKNEVFKGLIQALADLENGSVYHKDLTSANILYFRSHDKIVVHVADFNFSSTHDINHPNFNDCGIGAFYNRIHSPEVYLALKFHLLGKDEIKPFFREVSHKNDVWCAGLVLAEIFGIKHVEKNIPAEILRGALGACKDLPSETLVKAIDEVFDKQFGPTCRQSLIDEPKPNTLEHIIYRMLLYDYRKRPTGEELLKLFNSINTHQQ